MANALNDQPISIDTDIAVGWKAGQTLFAAGKAVGFRPTKVMLVSNGVTVAGTVTVSDPNDATIVLVPPIPVLAGAGAAGTVIYREDFQYPGAAAWRDFKVVGVTATVTRLLVWYRM